jgi:hypothetical protein
MTPMLIIRIFNTHRNHLIIPFSLAFTSFLPIRIALFGDCYHLTHANNGKFLAMLMNKLELYGRGCAKMLTAFLIYPFLAAILQPHVLASCFPLLPPFDDPFQEKLLTPALRIIYTIYVKYYLKYQDLWQYVISSFHWF